MQRRLTIVLITFAITNLLFNLVGWFFAGGVLALTAWIGLGLSLLFYGPQLLMYLLLGAVIKRDVPAYVISFIAAALACMGIFAAINGLSPAKLMSDIADNGIIFWLSAATFIIPGLCAVVYLRKGGGKYG